MSTSTQPFPTLASAGKRPPRFPRLPLFGALTFVAVVFVIVLFGRFTDIGTVRVATHTPVDIRDVVFLPQATGGMVVTDATNGAVIATIGPDEDGFVQGALRGLGRVRQIANVPSTQPYRLIKWQGGAVSLSDTGTGERIYLNAFGPDNAAAFARFLNHKVGDEQ